MNDDGRMMREWMNESNQSIEGRKEGTTYTIDVAQQVKFESRRVGVEVIPGN